MSRFKTYLTFKIISLDNIVFFLFSRQSRCYVRQFFLRQLKWFQFDSFLIQFDSQLVEENIIRSKLTAKFTSINVFFDSQLVELNINRTKFGCQFTSNNVFFDFRRLVQVNDVRPSIHPSVHLSVCLSIQLLISSSVQIHCQNEDWMHG